MAAATRKSKERRGASREVLKLTSRLVRRRLAKGLEAPREALSALAERTGGNGGTPLVQRVRSVPIQCSIDIAAPLEVAYEEWMTFEFLPEGTHRVQDIEPDGEDRLVGTIASGRRRKWEAEIREVRPNESFAWRSVKGSDCLGLVTFHRLSDRLTRLELELDVVPRGVEEAFELLTHIADRRAETDLRRFKAELERISPDDYPADLSEAGDEEQDDNEED